ncbi:ABC transporter, permease protein [Vibrio mimicus VM223]|nr:ABC transporter, permease protein [Vibrio mimicus VM223]
MDDAGQTGSAAAMAVMIMLTAGLMKLLHVGLEFGLFGRMQAWRKR